MFARLLEQIALGLEKRLIPYMVIGGQAVLLYGEPRLTRDIDVTLGAGPERLAELLELAKGWGWRVLVEVPAEFVQKTLVLPCLEPESGIRVDFIFSHSPYERQAMERVVRVNIGKAAVCFAAAEDVVVHKIIAGRARDLEDVRSILLKNPRLDAAYIRRWLEEFDRSLGESYLRRFEELRHSSG
jgi:predicted nucleotidyltransferase